VKSCALGIRVLAIRLEGNLIGLTRKPESSKGIGTNNQSIQQLFIHRNISMVFSKGNIFLEYDCIVLVLPGTSIIRAETTKQQTHFQCGLKV
jgi:hypothetical protein